MRLLKLGINGKIEMDWFNLSIETFKIRRKKRVVQKRCYWGEILTGWPTDSRVAAAAEIVYCDVAIEDTAIDESR